MNTNAFLAGICGIILLVTVAALSGLGVVSPDDKSLIIGAILGLSGGGAGGYAVGSARRT